MRPPQRHSGSDPAGLVLGVIAALIMLPACLVWIPLQLTKPEGYRGGGPTTALLDLWHGNIRWSTGTSLVAASEAVFVIVLSALLLLLWRHSRAHATPVDWAARRMATRTQLTKLAPAGVRASAKRLRPRLGNSRDPDQHGIPIGVTVAGSVELRQSWEDMACDIWGPRTGKTTARAIPAVVAAPGPVVVTSVKGDIVDATRDVRAQRGNIWLFDPMHILDRDHTRPRTTGFWWNPLRTVTTITAARILADHFSFAAQTTGGMVRDPFFDTKASDFVADLILAAAVAHRDLTQVYRWTTNQRDSEPAEILTTHGYLLPADSIHGVLAMPDRTRGSVYAIAEASLAMLTEPSVTAWITPPADTRPELDLTQFVASTDTLYLLSRAGPGTPAPLIAALTDAVLRAGEAASRRSAGRRLDPPLLSCLDEAANIVRIRQLPDLYSFYGSHGLPIITILQSWAQGEEVWGKAGMRKLWDSSNVRTYGGGVADPSFLDEISRNIGHYWATTRSVTTQSRTWDRTINRTPYRMRLLDVEELFAMPVGRMVVLPSGAPPVLVKTRPWQTGPYADAIKASLVRWDPRRDYDPALVATDSQRWQERAV